jgi:glycosyltransferase involved in cell wall biosynthesis
MTKKLSVTIAIPAYNEERNIERAVESLLNQKASNYILDKIIVVSDGSIDRTVQLVRDKFRSVIVKDFRLNRGKVKRLNFILDQNTSDVLVISDADIIIKNNFVISELVKKFIGNPKCGIVCAYHRAIKPDSIVGKISYFGTCIWDDARNYLGGKALRYFCEGGLIGYSRNMTNKLKFPVSNHVGDDTYSFYFAISNGFNVVIAKKAKVYVVLPATLNDYIVQMKRFLTDPKMVNSYFDQNLTNKFESITSLIKLKFLFVELFNTPFIGILFIILQVFVKLQMPFFKPSMAWKPIDRN